MVHRARNYVCCSGSGGVAMWYWIWSGWLLALVGTFAVLEGWALKNGGVTLSSFTDIVSEKWPPIIWVCGAMAGGLAVHFWWHWSGPGGAGG